MKKIVVIFAAMAAVLSSCQKSELESVSANEIKDIVLNISVSNPGAGDTKALVKTDWVKGDQIKIWFDTNTGADPDLVIKYDGSWKGTPASTPKSSGYIKAVYNNFVIVASTDEYTYTNNTLSFHIEHWKFLTEIQVVVKGLDYDVNEPYTLSCDKFTPLDKTGFKVTDAGIESVVKTKGDPAVGQANADGVAFVFATAEYSSSDAEFKFTLKNLINEDFGTREYTATTNKIKGTTGSMTTIKALTIDISKFAAPGLEYVEMKMGYSGDKTLKWATMNLGATTVAGSYTTCYGDLYQWGSVNTLYDGFPYTSATAGSFTWKTGKTSGFVAGNREYTGNDATLPDANDVVKQTYPGTNWRMPTSQEFEDLYHACGGSSTPRTDGSTSTTEKGVYWFTSYDGVAGLLFCDGVNKLFFPAAGVGSDTQLEFAGSSGYYWSSSLKTNATDYAFHLNFGSSTVASTAGLFRYYGFSVRPVSD